MTVPSKVRIYDLAKELKLDTRRLIEEIRREGVDVSIPSNSISKELAEKIRNKYFPKTANSSVPARQVRVLRPTAAALNAGIRPDQRPSPAITREPKSIWDGSLECELSKDDKILQSVEGLIDNYAGIVLTGPPGTSKTWYADQIAAALVDRDPGRVRFVQFHSSYQYEDFVEGYVPRKNGKGFELKKKHLLEMCDIAQKYDDRLCVMVIDELSRSDPARVFGEALTYIEPTKRDQIFHLASGNTASIPSNLTFIATMNPMDRGVEEVDAALERRFAKIAMDPDIAILQHLLEKNQMDENLRKSVVTFFRFLQGNSNERCKIGHAYFRSVQNESDLLKLWDHQLRFQMAKAFPLNSEGYRALEREWKKVFSTAKDRATVR